MARLHKILCEMYRNTRRHQGFDERVGAIKLFFENSTGIVPGQIPVLGKRTGQYNSGGGRY